MVIYLVPCLRQFYAGFSIIPCVIFVISTRLLWLVWFRFRETQWKCTVRLLHFCTVQGVKCCELCNFLTLIVDFQSSAVGKYIELVKQALQSIGGVLSHLLLTL